jgi:hypothetical protein
VTTLDAVSYAAIAADMVGVVWAVRETLVAQRLSAENELLRSQLRTRSVVSVHLEDAAYYSPVAEFTEPKRR